MIRQITQITLAGAFSIALLLAPATQALGQSSPAGSEQGTFVLRQGADTVATERFTRTGDRLQAELIAPNQARLTYAAIVGQDATVSQMQLQQYPANAPAGAAPAQRGTATFQGDSVFAESTQGDSTQTVQRATTRGAVPYLNPSPSLMEQIIRRARAIGGDRVEVPVFVLGSGGQTIPATVTFSGTDTAQLSLAGTDVAVTTDATGRLLRASIPAQNLTIERTSGAAP